MVAMAARQRISAGNKRKRRIASNRNHHRLCLFRNMAAANVISSQSTAAWRRRLAWRQAVMASYQAWAAAWPAA